MTNPRVFCYKTPINMRLSEDSLAALVSQSGHKLDSGDVFIFFNSKRTQCKIAWHDGRSYNSIDKQLASGTFSPDIEISDSALENLLSGGFMGSGELMSILRGAARGGKIIHISAAKSATHLR